MSGPSIRLSEEDQRLVIAFQRQADRIKSAITTLQDIADINDFIAFRVLQRLQALEGRVRDLERQVEELRKLKEGGKKGEKSKTERG